MKQIILLSGLFFAFGCLTNIPSDRKVVLNVAIMILCLIKNLEKLFYGGRLKKGYLVTTEHNNPFKEWIEISGLDQSLNNSY